MSDHISHKTRKPIDQLRPADLEAFPVWEFVDEENEGSQDETWVRPARTKQVPTDGYSLSVAATLTTPKGVEYRGIVGVNTAEGFEAVHAAVLTEDNYIFIPWPGMDGAAQQARSAAKELGLKASELFPLTYRLSVPVLGEASLREGVYRYASSDA
ncbi:MAG: hypothetical protein ACRCV9_06340 [Burkholderiaceae bacterium]